VREGERGGENARESARARASESGSEVEKVCVRERENNFCFLTHVPSLSLFYIHTWVATLLDKDAQTRVRASY